MSLLWTQAMAWKTAEIPPDGGFAHQIQPGDVMSQAAQVTRLKAMRDRMADEGFPVRYEDAHGYEQHAPHFSLESGHSVSVGLSRRDEGWLAHIYHPRDNRPDRSMIRVRLGIYDHDVPRLVRRELGCRHVTGEMVNQIGGMHHEGPKPRRPSFEHHDHDAEGATLPEDLDEG